LGKISTTGEIVAEETGGGEVGSLKLVVGSRNF